MAQFRLFPSFERLFAREAGDSVPPYLALLNLFNAAESRTAIEHVRASGRKSGDRLDAELHALLANVNWRPQLVGAVALLVVEASRQRLDLLWGALDRPSWVAPQLAAVASLTDPEFDLRTRERIERRCALDGAGMREMDGLLRHTARGPESVVGRSKKLLSALMRLCEARPHTAVWLAAYAATEDLAAMVASDVDRGGEIATRWLSQIEELLRDR